MRYFVRFAGASASGVIASTGWKVRLFADSNEAACFLQEMRDKGWRAESGELAEPEFDAARAKMVDASFVDELIEALERVASSRRGRTGAGSPDSKAVEKFLESSSPTIRPFMCRLSLCFARRIANKAAHPDAAHPEAARPEFADEVPDERIGAGEGIVEIRAWSQPENVLVWRRRARRGSGQARRFQHPKIR